MIYLLSIPLLALLAAGCTRPGPEAAFDTYLDRLARPLEVERPRFERAAIPRLPRRAELHIELPSTSLDTLDFLALTGCEVQITIGKRNSSLGRMASASQRLLLDLEYLRLAPACIEYMDGKGNAELAGLLRQAHRLKRQQLPARIFLATLAGPEFRDFWRPPSALGDYPGNTSSAVITALEAIAADSRRWLAGDYSADNAQFELQLSEIGKGDGGELLRALAMQASWLATADGLFAARAAEGPLCAPRIRPAAADIVPNVVRKFFVGDIQPWSAAVDRRQYQLLPPIRALETALAGALPDSYQRWRDRRDTLVAGWSAAPRRHVQAVQTLLAPCGGAAPA
ncbi:DUF3080 family protein [Parahaliea mediterranea]|uniref:DUF3080 family protein n=1 Tax=Parahaliea mediterranea TaxID=651086 RepID=A0A939IM53_9GAMM|nr:DUF3080 family protein [Parahaliea mediterranea]MBN7796652.1 DUF3080 family protein [Parahaliea mediterranea]